MKAQPTFPPLATVSKMTVGTSAAAFYLDRKRHTLHRWSSAGNAPEGLTPRRVHGRLAWPVEGLKRLLGVEPQQAE